MMTTLKYVKIINELSIAEAEQTIHLIALLPMYNF